MNIRQRNQLLNAFTLIELLIVIAIIAILALIAVPNFLEAQTRAKVSRVTADLRTLKTGLESYFADNGAFPYWRMQLTGQNNRGGIHLVTGLTTPLAYLTTVDLADPFAGKGARDEFGNLIGNPDPWGTPYSYGYVNIVLARIESNRPRLDYPMYLVLSLGPDYVRGPDALNPSNQWTYNQYTVDPIGTKLYFYQSYQPTNGTISAGDILMWQ